MNTMPRDGNSNPLVQTYKSVTSDRKTVSTAGTAEQLASDTACKRVDITAEPDNSGAYVVVGGSDVVAVDVQTNGDGVTYNYFD